ncbi:SNF2-related protein [Geodermatophilus sp. SYSU D00698]
MAELYLSGPERVTVPRSDVPAEVFAEMSDALAHVALEVTLTHVTLPLRDVAGWLWYFAGEDLPFTFDASLTAHLQHRLAESGVRLDVLSQTPQQQAGWPEGVGAPADLGIVREPTAPQRRDVARLVALGGGANFSVPGAGKTGMTYLVYSILKQRGDVEQMLVLAPISAHEAWQTEPAGMYAPGMAPRVHVGRGHAGAAEVLVTNYEQLENRDRLDALVAFCRRRRTFVVFDEAHRVKAGPTGIRGAAALELSGVAHRRSVLTGTPQPNSPIDLARVLDLAYPGHGFALAARDADSLMSAYSRVTKDELGLPPLVPFTEHVPLSAAHDQIYEAMVDAAARAVLRDPDLRHDFSRAGRIVMLLLQAATDPTAVLGAGGELAMIADRADLDLERLVRDLPESFVPTKFVRVAQLVDAHEAAGRKVLVWANFRHHVRRLQQLLAPHQPAVVCGDFDRVQRQSEIERFREDPGCQVLLATPHTLSEGVSLHHTTTHQIHVDRTFNAGMLLQSLDRTHRLGLSADADCTVTYLMAARRDGGDTIDDVVDSRLGAKVLDMARRLNDRGLATLAFPASEDELTDTDLLLGPGQEGDLAALFDHLRMR